MICVKIVSYSILVNGALSPIFKEKRGVRQGDPLSPYLFTFSIEYLTRLLKNLRQQNGFKFHPRCQKQKIIQPSFADDLLLFRREM